MVVRFVWGVDGGTFGVDVGVVVGGREAKGRRGRRETGSTS